MNFTIVNLKNTIVQHAYNHHACSTPCDWRRRFDCNSTDDDSDRDGDDDSNDNGDDNSDDNSDDNDDDDSDDDTDDSDHDDDDDIKKQEDE